MQPLASIPNKFQALIESEDAKYYLEQERIDKSVVISEKHLLSTLAPAIADGAMAHVSKREQAIRHKGSTDLVGQVADALWDSHFRKQRNFGPTMEAIERKVRAAIADKEPITLIALMFTRKNVCALKRNGHDTATADMAEVLSLTHLNSFAELISRFYPYGVRYIILSEGQRFARAFELDYKSIDLYQHRLERWIDRLGLKHLEVIDYEKFLAMKLGHKQWENRVVGYEEALSLYHKLMESILDPNNLPFSIEKAIELDPVLDPRNPRNNFVPLWDSIKHSLPYPEIATVAKKLNVEYVELYREIFKDLEHTHADQTVEELRQHVIEKSWAAAIEHNSRVMGDVKAGVDVAVLVSKSAFRTTINPKPGSPNLGIYSVRETTSRVQPWHGTAYLRLDGEGRLLPTVLSKLEIESHGGVPVCVGSKENYPFFYADERAVKAVKSKDPNFNMSTR
jgi:hypothetical protein